MKFYNLLLKRMKFAIIVMGLVANEAVYAFGEEILAELDGY